MTEKPGKGTGETGAQTTLAEEIRRGTGLQAVSSLFGERIKHPDRILIPNPDPAKRGTTITVNALIIPGNLLVRLPAAISTVRIGREQTVTGTLVALFIPGSTQPIEYRLYPKLLPDEQRGMVLYRPGHAPLKTHQVIYDSQGPAVQQRLLIATIQAIYLKEQQGKQASSGSKPPWAKIF